MKPKRTKDNLTDLIDEAQKIDGEDNNGFVTTPTGQVVKLDFDKAVTRLYEKIQAILKKKNK